jgi:purine-nucleoside/S-methyl-5'-thioadenosine phosphorylase / adenosine deaminase
MYTSPILKKQSGITHGFSEVKEGNMAYRFGAHSEVESSRRTFLAQISLTLKQCVAQAGLDDGIHVVTNDDIGLGMHDRETSIQTNALITNKIGVGLFLTIADCIPIILYDPVKRVIALIHAARASTNLLLPGKVAERLNAEFKCYPADILAVLGPAVRAESYIYDQGIYNLVTPAWKPYLHEVKPGHIEIDNIGYARAQLVNAGLLEQNIDDSRVDTGRDPNYFSHVRSVHTGAPEGRLAAVVALR